MKRLASAILLVYACGASLGAQEQTPSLLLHAAQCLAAKDFLPESKITTMSLGYLLDEKSYPGEKVVYVVLYTGTDRFRGMAFALFVTEQQGQQVFNIQNNAIFARIKCGVKFTTGGDPLGGIWTQQHLVSAIKRIERRPRFKIPVAHLSPSPPITCEAYTDKER